MIIIDAYNGQSIPEELLTQEFFEGIHALTPELMINVITDRTMESNFSQ
jgi:spermidine synthase